MMLTGLCDKLAQVLIPTFGFKAYLKSVQKTLELIRFIAAAKQKRRRSSFRNHEHYLPKKVRKCYDIYRKVLSCHYSVLPILRVGCPCILLRHADQDPLNRRALFVGGNFQE